MSQNDEFDVPVMEEENTPAQGYSTPVSSPRGPLQPPMAPVRPTNVVHYDGLPIQMQGLGTSIGYPPGGPTACHAQVLNTYHNPLPPDEEEENR